MKSKGYSVINSRYPEDKRVLQTFSTKRECKEWLTEGMFGTEGAEQSHYVGMLAQLEEGEKTLDYEGRYTY